MPLHSKYLDAFDDSGAGVVDALEHRLEMKSQFLFFFFFFFLHFSFFFFFFSVSEECCAVRWESGSMGD